MFQGSIPVANGNSRTFYSLYSGIFLDTSKVFGGFHLPKSVMYSTGAYSISDQEPFASAPMLQMYYYLGQPLLVARSSTGIVTDVFFQGRTIANPMERAKKYLGKKWYSP